MAESLIRIDTNLLVLLVAGLVEPEIIRKHKHKRLRKYSIDDFYLLYTEIGHRKLCILPNVATESHNILAMHGDPERGHLLEMLGRLLSDSIDNYVPNRIAVESAIYSRIGLADAALYVTRAPTLLTDDLALYVAALEDGQRAVRFLDLRVAAGIVKPE